jgi:hypothetical protein
VRETGDLVETLAADAGLIHDTRDMHSGTMRVSLAAGGRLLSRVKHSAGRQRRSLQLSLLLFTAAAAFVVLRRLRVLALLTPLLSGLGGAGIAFLIPINRSALIHDSDPLSGEMQIQETIKLRREIEELEALLRGMDVADERCAQIDDGKGGGWEMEEGSVDPGRDPVQGEEGRSVDRDDEL